jgi:hypothetical protein
MMSKDKERLCIGRRDFIKTTAMAVVGSTLAGPSIYARETGILSRSQFGGSYGEKNNKLLCLSEFPEEHLKMIDSIRSDHGIDLQVSLIEVNFENPWDLVESIQNEGADILFVCLGHRFIFNYGVLYRYMGNLDIPILVYSPDQDLIMIDANLVAELRLAGANVKLAVSEMEVIEILREVAFPRYIRSNWEKEAIETLEGIPSPSFILGRKALIYSSPFDSISVPSHNLTEEYVYDHTGVEIGFRPLDELMTRLEDVDESSATEEMERWRDEATGVDEVPSSVLLDQCRLYILLRSIIEEEGLSAISIDCLRFTLNSSPILPIPCLAFARLRDEGITASCEADVCGLLSSMVFETISERPSFFANVASVDKQRSSTVLRHCAAPLKLMGLDSPQQPYKLHDYHGFGNGLTPKVEFPIGIDVTMGSYTKDLKGFLVWPGTTCTGIDDTDEPMFPDSNIRRFCSNRVEIEIGDVDRFFQNIANLHHIMVTGNYTEEFEDIMSIENISIIGPLDSNGS